MVTKKHKKNKAKIKLNIPFLIFTSMFFLLSISVIAEIFVPTYKTNPLFYAAFGTIAGLTVKSFMK